MNVLPPSSLQHQLTGRSTCSATRENGGKPAIAPRVSGPSVESGGKTSVQDDVSVAAAEKGWKPVVVTRVSGSNLKNGGKPAIQPRVSGLPPPGNNKMCSAYMKSAVSCLFYV
jgi:hypothetical protein